jgi:phosphoribosylanthranilate isomerase
MSVEIKICGLTRREDVELAVSLGADFLGFVIYPGSRRFVPPERLPELTRGLPPCVGKVGVFVDATRDEILFAAERGGLDVVQLHGRESAEFARSLGFPRIWKATYDPDFPAERVVCDAPTGGSGNFGDHEKAAELAKVRLVMLAGGITPFNAAELVARVRPAGIDLAGGVESAPGVKDEFKMRQLFRNVKGDTL